MEALTLNTGAPVSPIGFGSGTPSEEVSSVVLEAVKLGYRHFDTAAVYATEAAIGDGLQQAFEQNLVRREDIFVTSKLSPVDSDPDDVLPALRKSLSKLKLQYLDLWLIHFPFRADKLEYWAEGFNFLAFDIVRTWEAMEKCVEEGLTKSIGVSNLSTTKLKHLVEHARIVPAVNQVELHPVWQQRKLQDFCKRSGIQLFAWSPLGGLGKPWGSKSVLENTVIQELASKYQRTPAQIIIRWITQQGVGVIVKSYNRSRLSQNLGSFEFSLSADDCEKISTIEQERLGKFAELCTLPTSPYKSIQELWDGEV